MVTRARVSEKLAVTSAVVAPNPHQPVSRAKREPRQRTRRFLVPVPDTHRQIESQEDPAIVDRTERDAAGAFEISAPASRAVVIESLVRARARCALSVGAHYVLAEASAAHELDLVLSLEASGSSGTCTLRCDLHGVPFLLTGRLDVLEPDASAPVDESSAQKSGGRRAVLSGVRVYTLDERRGRRVAIGKGQGTLRWARVVEGAPKVIHSSLVDLTPAGASIELEPSDPVPPSASFVGELHLGNVKIPLLASLRRCERRSDNVLAGLRLEIGGEKRKLVDLYMRQRFPGLVRRHEVESEALGKLLAESGYLKLRDGEGCSSFWHRYRSPHSLDFVYRARDGALLGHVSSTRSYRRSWLMHQLATLSGHSESGLCRRALYDLVSCAPTVFEGEQAFAVAYFNRKLRWHQLFLQDFVQWLNDDALGTVTAFDRFERAPNAAAPTPQGGATGYSVEPLADEDVIRAVALIRSQVAPLVADALDINPQDLVTASLNGDPLRSRAAFALRRGRELLGVALCETGSASASLFNIFNLAHFYVCSGVACPPVEAQLALLSAVREHYARKGTSSPLIVAPPGTFAAQHEPGTVLAESMGCFVVSGVGLRQWEHYCRLQMGRLYQRKSAVSKTGGGAHVN